jgi:hypothetical protein
VKDIGTILPPDSSSSRRKRLRAVVLMMLGTSRFSRLGWLCVTPTSSIAHTWLMLQTKNARKGKMGRQTCMKL